MRKLKVYLDISVVSYLHQEDAPEKMKDTLALWDAFRQGRYAVYLSDIVLNEIGACTQGKLSLMLDYLSRIEYHLIQTDEDTVALAEKFINFGILKQKSFDDCRHIAAATIAGCDIITSWNFKHIVNVKTVRGVKTITTLEGYKDLLIYPPSVLLEGDEDDDETGRE